MENVVYTKVCYVPTHSFTPCSTTAPHTFCLHGCSGDLLISGEGHLDWLSAIEFHPEGNQLASTSGDGSVKLWDFNKASCVSTFTEHQQPGSVSVWSCTCHEPLGVYTLFTPLINPTYSMGLLLALGWSPLSLRWHGSHSKGLGCEQVRYSPPHLSMCVWCSGANCICLALPSKACVCHHSAWPFRLH